MLNIKEIRAQFPILNRKVNGNDLIKYDNALVPNMNTSKYLYKLFQNNKNTINISMECKYSHIFKKWIPIKQVENEPYKLQDIEKLVEQLVN